MLKSCHFVIELFTEQWHPPIPFTSLEMAKKSAKHWVEKFGLEDHPFMPGYFKETFRDSQQVEGGEAALRGPRNASTLIYFLHLPEQKLGEKYIAIFSISKLTEKVTLHK